MLSLPMYVWYLIFAVIGLIVLAGGLLVLVAIGFAFVRMFRKKPEPAAAALQPAAFAPMAPALVLAPGVDPKQMQTIAGLIQRHNDAADEAAAVDVMIKAAKVAAKPVA